MVNGDTPKRVTRLQHILDQRPSFNLGITQLQDEEDASSASIEAEKSTEHCQDPIATVQDELKQVSKSAKRKDVVDSSKMSEEVNGIEKKRKVIDVDLDTDIAMGNNDNDVVEELAEEIA